MSDYDGATYKSERNFYRGPRKLRQYLLRSIESLPENNHIDGNAKLEIVTELENMVVETKENIDSIPDERTGYLVKAYNLQVPASFRKDAQLNEIYEGITSIKGLLQK